MRFRWLILCLGLLPFMGQGQVYLGGNAGSLLGRTVDVYGLYHPKNQDWVAISVSGGYTVPGPLFFPHSYPDYDEFRHSGYHARLGARNFITTDHLSNHLFWGGHMNYAGVTEKATNISGTGEGTVKNNFGSFGLQFDAGYSLCLNPHAMRDKWKLDLGMQVGFPLTQKDQYLGAASNSATYVPGLGYGRAGEEAVNLQLIVLLRYMMWDGRYGHFRHRTTRHNRRPKKAKPFKVPFRDRMKSGSIKSKLKGGGKKDKPEKGEKPEKPPKEKKKKKSKGDDNQDDS